MTLNRYDGHSGEEILSLVRRRQNQIRESERERLEEEARLNRLREYLMGPLTIDLRREVEDEIYNIRNGTISLHSIQEAYDGSYYQLIEELGGDVYAAGNIHRVIGHNLQIITEPDQLKENSVLADIKERERVTEQEIKDQIEQELERIEKEIEETGRWYDPGTGQYVGSISRLVSLYPGEREDNSKEEDK